MSSGQGESLTNGLPNNKPIDKAKIADFWERMTGLFGYRWASQYGKLPTKEWAMLINHLSMEAIETGIKNMTASNKDGWPPTPIEFNNLCKGISLEALGFPSPDIAFSRVTSGRATNAVIKAAAKELDSHDLRTLRNDDKATFNRLKKEFEYYYFEMARRWANGESLTKPVAKALENTGQNKVSKGVFDEFIDQQVQAIKQSGKTGREVFLESRKEARA